VRAARAGWLTGEAVPRNRFFHFLLAFPSPPDLGLPEKVLTRVVRAFRRNSRGTTRPRSGIHTCLVGAVATRGRLVKDPG
jgi:hypothetical protein